jgi:putative hemolysin
LFRNEASQNDFAAKGQPEAFGMAFKAVMELNKHMQNFGVAVWDWVHAYHSMDRKMTLAATANSLKGMLYPVAELSFKFPTKIAVRNQKSDRGYMMIEQTNGGTQGGELEPIVMSLTGDVISARADEYAKENGGLTGRFVDDNAACGDLVHLKETIEIASLDAQAAGFSLAKKKCFLLLKGHVNEQAEFCEKSGFQAVDVTSNDWFINLCGTPMGSDLAIERYVESQYRDMERTLEMIESCAASEGNSSVQDCYSLLAACVSQKFNYLIRCVDPVKLVKFAEKVDERMFWDFNASRCKTVLESTTARLLKTEKCSRRWYFCLEV